MSNVPLPDPKRIAYINPTEAYSEPTEVYTGLCQANRKRELANWIGGLECDESYDGMYHNFYMTCASDASVCSDRGCLIDKGQIRFTHTRFDTNYFDVVWHKPQSFCLRCAPPYDLQCKSWPTEHYRRHLPEEAHSLVDAVIKMASDETPYFEGYGEEGEASIESVAKYADEEDLREYKKVKRAYEKKKRAARATPRRISRQALEYRCNNDSLLKPEPQAGEDPFEPPDASILMNWHRIEY